MQTRDESFPGRRRFLKQAVAIGGTGVLVVLAAGEAGAGPEPPNTSAAAAPGTQGYRQTEHIRTYYDTTRS